MACDQCRKRKLKCDEQRPCETCRTRELPCTISSTRKGPGRPRNPVAHVSADTTPSSHVPENLTEPVDAVLWQTVPCTSNPAGTVFKEAALSNSEPHLSETVDPSSPVPTVASRFQVLAQPNEPTFPLAAFEGTFPSLFGLPNGEPDTIEWNDRDIDLLSGLWDPPISETAPWFYDVEHPGINFPDQPVASSKEFQIENSLSWIHDHFRRRSRTLSPSATDANRMWYSTPPQLQIYDKEMLNMLLNIARRHVGTTFKIFLNYEAGRNTSRELCLAMAAIGALFLGVDCGITVAKSLYNDARRLHFENFHSEGLKLTFRAASDSVKTFILLAIYGISSGDKRSYEFIEAFHLSMMQAMKYCLQFTPLELTPDENEELPLISEAVEIMESYHVLLLQRPPYILPTLHEGGSERAFKIDLNPLFCPNDQAKGVSGSLREVANLGAYTWAAMPKGREHSRQWQLWRPEFIELGLERWLSANMKSRQGSNLPSMLLYHLSHLQLQVNLSVLQLSARDFTKTPETSKEQNTHATLQNCMNGRYFEAAVWHAKAMLQLVAENLDVSERGQPKTAVRQRRMLEPPHLPYCIYFSTLIVWYGEDSTTSSHSLARDARIKDGIRMLGMLKIRVAKVLMHALRELLPDE